MANAPTMIAGWRHPNLNEWMPSTNTDTAMPRHSASPSAAQGEPGFGREHRRVGEEAGRDPHHGPADEREHPAAGRPGQPIAGGDEQRHRGRDHQSPHRPARGGRSGVEAQDLRQVEVGAEREPERGLVDARVRVRDRPREQEHEPAHRRDHRDPEAAHHRTRRSRDRDREQPASPTAITKSPSPTGYHAPSSAASTASRRTPRPLRASSLRSPRRTMRSSRNGSNAKSTSGPRRPCAIALRATGLMPYARPRRGRDRGRPIARRASR